MENLPEPDVHEYIFIIRDLIQQRPWGSQTPNSLEDHLTELKCSQQQHWHKLDLSPTADVLGLGLGYASINTWIYCLNIKSAS